jgi:hypothetical protein
MSVHERGVDWVRLESRNECGGFPVAAARGAVMLTCHSERSRGISGIRSCIAHRTMMLQQYFRVLLLAATQRAADGIEPEQFGRLNRLGREMFVFERASPVGNVVR